MKTELLGLNKCLKHLNKLRSNVDIMASEIIKELAKIGKRDAKWNFSKAQYDGDSRVEVDIYPDGKLKLKLCATGSAVVYIEFGAGITYIEQALLHPQRDTISPPINSIGSTQKSSSGKHWFYRGKSGKNPTDEHIGPGDTIRVEEKERLRWKTVITNGKTYGPYLVVEKARERDRKLKPGIHGTKGNPPARAMLFASADMRSKVITIIEKVVRKYA